MQAQEIINMLRNTGRRVVFVVGRELGLSEDEYPQDGDVQAVDEQGQSVLICFLCHGYGKAVRRIPFSHIAAIFDEANGTEQEIGQYVGHFVDVRHQAPFGTHPIPIPTRS